VRSGGVQTDVRSIEIDAADALVLGEALTSHSDLFVTGDGALQRLAAIGALKIVSSRRFWEVLRGRKC
jgi:hypothetical protein